MAKTPTTARIDALLAQKNISKAQFYEDCQITSASYSQWNTGKTAPKMKNIYRIAEYLETTPEYLLTGIEVQKNKPTTEIGDELSDVKREAWNVIQDMDEETLEKFIKMAKAVLGEL